MKGRIIKLKAEHLKSIDTVDISLTKISPEKLGCLQVVYKNACFNCLGFLCHDTYASEE